MTCSAAPKLAYGSIQVKTSTFVNYTCNAGYSLQGTSTVECSNGVWNMSDYPICLLSLENYSNESMSYHKDSNTTTDASADFSEWFVYGVMGSGGCLALAIVVSCLLACCHICGCCPGPVVAVGGRYQYSDRRWYSVFSWCDFIVKGKVCRKIRAMNKSKVISPGLDTLTIEDETTKTENQNEESEKAKDGVKPPDDNDPDDQTSVLEKDVSSSTSGYASSSPSSSPLPEEEALLPDSMATEASLTNNKTKTKKPPAASGKAVLSNIKEDDSNIA